MATIWVDSSNIIQGGPLGGKDYSGSLDGTDGDDVIVGTEGADSIDAKESSTGDCVCSLGGNDSITTKGGDDWINAGDGDNTIDSGPGDDIVYCGSGNDYIQTNEGNDTVYAGDGDDDIQTGPGEDCVDSGYGNDEIQTGDDDDCVTDPDGGKSLQCGSGTDHYNLDPGAFDSVQECEYYTAGCDCGSEYGNDAPVAVANSYSTDENSALTITAPGVLENDSDADGDSLTAALDSDVSNGSLTLNADGSFAYTPAADFNGSDSFTYHANDGTADSNTVAVSITVTPVNDAPVAVADSYTVAEGGTPGVLANDTDAEDDTLTAIKVSDPAHGTLTLNADGSFTYTHNGSETTSDSFTYKANDGTADSNTVAVSITVTPVNDAPVAPGQRCPGGQQ
jgi:VCBS repeat-containing protein